MYLGGLLALAAALASEDPDPEDPSEITEVHGPATQRPIRLSTTAAVMAEGATSLAEEHIREELPHGGWTSPPNPAWVVAQQRNRRTVGKPILTPSNSEPTSPGKDPYVREEAPAKATSTATSAAETGGSLRISEAATAPLVLMAQPSGPEIREAGIGTPPLLGGSDSGGSVTSSRSGGSGKSGKSDKSGKSASAGQGAKPLVDKAAVPPEQEDGGALEEGWWHILTQQPSLLILLGLGTTVVLLVICLSLRADSDSLKDVLSTVPHTPLELLPHREYQIVKTRGVVTPVVDGDKLNSPLTSDVCVYSRTVVEKHSGRRGWEPLLDLVESRPFLLVGGETRILCEVTAQSPAVLDMPPSSAFDGDLVQLPAPIQSRIRGLPGPKLPAYAMFRVVEWTFAEGDDLVAMGLVVRRVSRKETRTALSVGGLSATNADVVASLFSPIRVSSWREVANRVVLGLPSGEESGEGSKE